VHKGVIHAFRRDQSLPAGYEIRGHRWITKE
jgi:hypothetical protein